MSEQKPAPQNQDTRRAPIALWRVAGAFLTILYNLFGDAADIAARHTITREARAIMLPWLRAAEALVRRLLLIEAAHYARDELKPSRPCAPGMRERKLVAFDPATPEAWRVTFRCVLDPRRPRRRHAGGLRRDASRFHSAWPVAERCEAMLRAYNDPAPYARRLARRLYAAPHRAAALIAYAPPSTVNRDGFEATQAPSDSACAHFDSS